MNSRFSQSVSSLQEAEADAMVFKRTPRWVRAFDKKIGHGDIADFKKNSARLVVKVVGWFLAPLALLITASDLLTRHEVLPGHIVIALGLLAAAALPFVTRWTRRPYLSGFALILISNLTFAWLAAQDGGILSPFSLFLILPVFWSWLTLSIRASLPIAILTVIEIVSLTVMCDRNAFAEYRQGIFGLDLTASFGLSFGGVLLLGVVSGVATWTNSRAHEAELIKKRNEALLANREKSEFIASIAHEVRTPLTQLMGMLELLAKDKALDADQAEMAFTAKSSARNILSIINDLLDLSKIEVGELRLLPEPMDAVDLFRRTVREFQPMADDKKLQLKISAPEKPVWLLADPTRFRQCLSNYLSNAVKFTERGTIHAKLECRECESGDVDVEMSVADTGPGIPASLIRKVFARFVQVDGTQKSEHGGTGLGLAIVADLARLQGGRAWVESQEGRGSTFFFDARFRRTSALELPNDQSNRATGLSILVADDSIGNQRVLTRVLQGLGYRTFSAADGSEALKILITQPIDLILMDQHMPVKDGPTTLADIRSLPDDRRNTPVIGLSADHSEDDMKRWTDAGVDGFVQKPVDFEALDLTIRRILGVQRQHFGGEDSQISTETPASRKAQ